MDDDKIYSRGGTDRDVEEYAKQNGADLTRADVEIEAIVKEFRLLTQTPRMQGYALDFHNLDNWLGHTLTAQQTKHTAEMEDFKKNTAVAINTIATRNGYALAIKHFEERMKVGQPVFEAIEEMKSLHNNHNIELTN